MKLGGLWLTGQMDEVMAPDRDADASQARENVHQVAVNRFERGN